MLFRLIMTVSVALGTCVVVTHAATKNVNLRFRHMEGMVNFQMDPDITNVPVFYQGQYMELPISVETELFTFIGTSNHTNQTSPTGFPVDYLGYGGTGIYDNAQETWEDWDYTDNDGKLNWASGFMRLYNPGCSDVANQDGAPQSRVLECSIDAKLWDNDITSLTIQYDFDEIRGYYKYRLNCMDVAQLPPEEERANLVFRWQTQAQSNISLTQADYDVCGRHAQSSTFELFNGEVLNLLRTHAKLTEISTEQLNEFHYNNQPVISYPGVFTYPFALLKPRRVTSEGFAEVLQEWTNPNMLVGKWYIDDALWQIEQYDNNAKDELWHDGGGIADDYHRMMVYWKLGHTDIETRQVKQRNDWAPGYEDMPPGEDGILWERQ